MKKILQIICAIFFISIMLAVSNSPINLRAFYFDTSPIAAYFNTGRIDVSIENLTVKNDTIIWSGSEGTLSDVLILSNTSNTFSFDAVNHGDNSIRFLLQLELGWDAELGERGKLFVYTSDFDDETIYHNIKNGIGEGAIIGSGDSDDEIIEFSNNYRRGIRVNLDSGLLLPKVVQETGGSVNFVHYELKIFFFEDDDIIAEPIFYHNCGIELGIVMQAELDNSRAIWNASIREFFIAKSVISGRFPVISEVLKPKIFFVDQTSNINLMDYAIAEDSIEGDLTSKITVSSEPMFAADKAGVYTITYNVKNSQGNEATPLVLRIVIWDFTKIISGNYHTLAMTSHGRVYTWGYNAYGQLGDGTTTYKQIPQPVDGLENIVDIAAGNECSYALMSNGQAYSWGNNESGRLGDGTSTTRTTPVKVLQPIGVNFVSIAANFATAGGVTPEGDVYTWGDGRYGAAGTGNANDNRMPTKIDVSNIESLSLGYYNGAAVTKDGRIYTWGDNLYGQLGNGVTGGTTIPPTIIAYFGSGERIAKSISVGWYHMAAVDREGHLYTWGYGAQGRLGTGSETSRNTPQFISLGYVVKKAMADFYFTGILTQEGVVLFCGQNAFGKHGTGNATDNHTPVKAQSIDGALDIALALDSSFVLVEGRTVYGMGYGGTGVLGTGNNNNSLLPIKWAFIPPPPY